MGVIVIGSSFGKVESRARHMRRGLPLISAEQDPHLPALQFQRTARSPACCACTWCTASSTTSPSSTSTVKSTSSPPFSSPRQIRIFRSYAMLFGLQQFGELGRHHGERLVLERDLAGLVERDD